MILLWTRNTKTAKIMAIVMGALAAICLLWGLVAWGRDFYRQVFHDEVRATVTERYLHMSGDRQQAWTDAVYEYRGETHTIRFEWFIPWAREGSEVRLLINPNNPQDIVLITPAFGRGKIGGPLIGMCLFGAFFLLYLINFRSNRKRDRLGE